MNGWHKWMILSWVAALSACNSDEIGGEGVQTPIGFVASVVSDMEARETTNPDITSMGVYAYYTGNSSWGGYEATATTPNFMSNQEIKKESDSWTYSPIKYWPNSASDQISFFAYAPYAATTTSESAPKITFNSESEPSFTCTLPAALPTTEPNLFLASLTDQTKSTAKLKFTFKYALTRVSFKVTNSTAAPITVNSLNITAPTVGNFRFGETNNGYTCETDVLPLSTTSSSEGSLSTILTTKESEILATFYLLPDNAHVSCTLSLGSDSSDERTFSLKDDTKPWECGKSITYNLILQ